MAIRLNDDKEAQVWGHEAFMPGSYSGGSCDLHVHVRVAWPRGAWLDVRWTLWGLG